jgi:AcrR family transcriptional regulator/DNA-binding MarR family transcriptional regulator
MSLIARPPAVMRGPRMGGDRSAGREQVARIQRARMLAATVQVASERGAGNVTVARVVARSGVSRRTFYELFTSGEECLLAVMEDSLARARSYVLEVYDPSEAWRVRIRAALHALLEFVDDEPARGRLLVVESLCAGPEALERRSRVLDQLIVAVDAGRGESERSAGLTPLTAEGVVGSVLSIIHARLLAACPLGMPARVLEGGRPALVGLTNPLMSMIVLPYLGAAAARRELDRPLPKHRRRAPHASNGAGHLNDLPMRVTYRTLRVLSAIASQPGASNRQAGDSAGITDQGQISKLLHRLEKLGLILNAGAGQARGTPNAWTLTEKGAEIERATRRQTSGPRSR